MPNQFDETLYLDANPDVRLAVAQGSVPTGLDHWQSAGADEHARGIRRSGFYDYDLIYDEAIYLRNNADVAAEVLAGKLRDGYQHWICFGRAECADGRRADCFETKSHGFRPFRIEVAAVGELLVAAISAPLPSVERLSLLRDDDTRVTLDPANVSCSREIRVADEAGRATTERLLLFWVPAGLGPHSGRAPKALSCAVISTAGDVSVTSFAEVGGEKPFFASIDDANEFVLAAKRLTRLDRHGAALATAVGELVSSRVFSGSPDADEPYSDVHIEHLLGIEGAGIYVSGWLIPASRYIERCRAWCPETGECVEFQTTLTRTRRPDVRQTFNEKLGAGTEDHFGFLVLLHLPEASRLPEYHLVLGIVPKGGREHVGAPKKSKPPGSFVEAVKIVLANLNPADPHFEQVMARTIGPAVEALWTRERAGKPRTVVVRRFGEQGAKPIASVVVPIYGRADFIKHQLALFANDDDFKSGAVELIYFIDDPRLIEDVLQVCMGWAPLYRVPMIVAYTGENHGFSGANNVAASVARGDLLVLLNSDVMPKRSGWVTEVARAYDSLPDCGVLGTKLLYYDESLQHDGMIFERFPFWNGLYGNNHPGKGLPNRSESGAPAREVEAVTGACLAMSLALYRELGGLSEEFVFGDFEDSELCLRVRNAGKRIYYLPGVELYHLERQSQSLLPDGDSWRWQLTVHNAWLQDRKWREHIDELKRSPIAGGKR